MKRTVFPKQRNLRLVALMLLAVCFWAVTADRACAAAALTLELSPETKAVLDKDAPQSIADLKLVENQTQKVVEKVVSATVSVRVGGASGSGVIVSEDGLVLTAAHVNGQPGRKVTFIFPDGRKAKGVTLGMNNGIDSGLMKITDEGPWPFVEMGQSKEITPGKWCIAIGHPGGFDAQRPYVVRLGRVIRANKGVIQTDCTLVGGDSGGPLYDMEGRVIGIHSRISMRAADNFHVPIQTYYDTFDRLKNGESFGGRDEKQGPKEGDPYVGVQGDDHTVDSKPAGVKINGVMLNQPAARAGLQPGDIVQKFNDTEIKDFAHFGELIREAGAEAKVVLELKRGDAVLNVQLTIGKR